MEEVDKKSRKNQRSERISEFGKQGKGNQLTQNCQKPQYDFLKDVNDKKELNVTANLSCKTEKLKDKRLDDDLPQSKQTNQVSRSLIVCLRVAKIVRHIKVQKISLSFDITTCEKHTLQYPYSTLSTLITMTSSQFSVIIRQTFFQFHRAQYPLQKTHKRHFFQGCIRHFLNKGHAKDLTHKNTKFIV
ncbi:hypothetical protein L596_012475 [Steinernema carpocapsae]|uniref:Uncharacterized protein n=1 Tax=Steinernema carpocapsae TaxID=34508 RepID=A0A4U5NXZ6_STECR|nr:hypothetical protein L596_012475 [Steinernema carpocapsae]